MGVYVYIYIYICLVCGLSLSFFIDDDKEKQGRLLAGKRIYSPDILDSLSKKNKISHLLLALPNLNDLTNLESWVKKHVTHF